MTLTAQFVAKATGATPQNAERFLPFLQGACEAYGIDTHQRQAAFLSQIGHESGGMSTLEEGLNYSVDALLKLFGRHRISQDDCLKYGRTATQRADQEAIANLLYGGEWGRKNLGNTEPGDGWRYRGRGLKQLTGRANYTACGQAIGEDLINNPDRLLQPVNAALSAGWFWHSNNCNALADKGDIPALTKKINGGNFGLAQRQILFAAAMDAGGALA